MATVTYQSSDSGSLLCVDHAESLIAAGGENGALNLWDSATQQLLHQYVPDDSDDDCTSLRFTKDSSLLFAAFNKKICQFDKRTFLTPVETYHYNIEEINQLNINDKETLLASCDDSGETKIFSLQERKVIKTLRSKHSNICSAVVFRPNHQWEVMTAGLDCKLIHWYFAKPKVMNEINMQELLGENIDEAQILNPPLIHHINFSPNGFFLACALENGIVKVFDSNRKHLRDRFSLRGHNQGVSQVDFLSNRFMVSGGNDKQIIVWDLEKLGGSGDGANGAEVVQPQQLNGHMTNGQGSAHSNTAHDGVSDNGDDDDDDDVDDSHNNNTADCKVFTTLLSNKVNWLKSVTISNQHYIFVADESTKLSRITIDGL
ncbi:WD repeat-containing protein 53 [Octopus bimaculoides]|uniref:Uncharacterized protein n=1 Tax=Octopus bimaculoides TaxID=37653 RepID=A0A0L8GQ17_OCTBM|nr:WD repeat-containing protein 53 [Octopus bimaculoides]XP_014779057.1 WD repeat-containing protein 53 [Octopus bimaculoides]XP_014779058.1 WD repeat-containing protein 53 [Octopus bimaculoides]XP_052830649.1 WD repeat-containing protein 53 [Octopus bimaculoides]|eukprot:XP_014779056.1 PREDICTED: WD repeat-containing protein 53-like [Octopus bimaculoides]